MELTFRQVELADLEWLAEIRIEVLRAANHLEPDMDMQAVKQYAYGYYKHALQEGSHIAFLCFDKTKWIGTGGISFYQVLPTYDNPTGHKAYIMNMYTIPEYRRKGIAYQMLDLLVLVAKERKIYDIGLEATDMGRTLYEKYGFQELNHEMRLPQQNAYQ